MKQQCYLWNIWLTWLGLPALAIIIGLLEGWWAAGLVLLVGVLAQVLYLRLFPRISHWRGYGSVQDEAAERLLKEAVPQVILYTANVCPFCPIVRQRLLQLQRDLEYDLKEVDVTFRPNLIRAKGLRSVPVVEAAGRYWIGNATTAQLAAFLTRRDSTP